MPKKSTALAVPCTATQEHQVLIWLLEGHSDFDVAEAIADKMPGVDAKALLERIAAKLDLVGQADSSVIRGWCLEAYRECYKRMMASGDYPNAARVIKELAKLA